ncbi:MAG: O-antigen ligase family protein [Planctomycetota bacterium]
MQRASPLLAFAFICLLALAMAMPLLPQAEGGFAAKHIAFLALAGAGVLALWMASLLGARLPATGTPTDLALLAFFALAVPSAWLAANEGMARYTAGLLLALGFTYLLALKTLTNPARVRWLALAVLCVALVISCFGLLGYQGFLAAGADEMGRAQALSTPFFAHSYLAAQYLVMVLVAGFVLLLERALSRGQSLALAALLLPIGAFVLVIGSRGAYLAVLVALVCHVLLRASAAGEREGRRHLLLRLLSRGLLLLGVLAVLLTLATLTGLLPGAAQHALARVLLVFDPQASDFNFARLSIWSDTLRMAADHLLFGVGPGGFDTLLPTYHVAARPVPHAHNQFLHLLAEHGLVGLVAFLFLLRTTQRAVVRGTAHLQKDTERRGLFHAAVAALVAALVYFLFETPLVWAEAGSLIMILLAVVTRAGCDSRERLADRRHATAGLLASAALLFLVVPNWINYSVASREMTAHIRHREAGDSAEQAGDRATAEHEYSAAVDALQRADAAFPWRPDFHVLRARLLFRLGRLDEALQALRLADARQPGSFRTLHSLGVLLLHMKRAGDAIDPLRRAISAHRGPEAAESYAALGRSFLAMGRYEEAWIVFYSLLDHGLWYDSAEPSVLLDAARTLVQLDRNLAQARVFLNRYRVRAAQPGSRIQPFDLAQADELYLEVERRLARPRRDLPPR